MVEIIVTIALEVAKCLAPPAREAISYLRKHKSNFKNLKDEVEKLKDESTRIQRRVDAAKKILEGIEENVEKWLARASNFIKEVAEKFPEDEETAQMRCCKGLCPDLKTRYQLSKEAVSQREAVITHLKEAEKFDKISYPIILQDPRLFNKDYQAFESRKSILLNVISSLSNPDVNIVGIYGMGGIGKTTLAKEVGKQAMDSKLFDPVLFAEVSQRPDIRKIQKEIAEKLGLTLFEEDSESNLRGKLYRRLRDEKKILIILDNIWESLDLENSIGIPLGDYHKGCKVLLTARSVEVLLADPMRCRQNLPVDVLEGEEAWSLFRSKAGRDIEGSELESVARQVAEKCAGLPLAIKAVASALGNKKSSAWKDALRQLSRPSSTKFKNIQKEAYSAIELSYNLLEDKEIQNIFLLIGYTYITLVDDLLMYGVGLGLFEGIHKMEEAQDRVRALVDKLRDSSMLLDDKNNVEDFIMHDVVRDVAISIASGDQFVFTRTNQQVDESEINGLMSKGCNSIVLIDAEIPQLPEVLECPELKLFSIRARDSSLKLSDNFFKTMIELRVLDLTYMDLSSPPSSLGLLTNLGTLCLYGCNLDNMAVIGGLKKLEILFVQSSDIKQLPIEVGQLTQLRSLELRDCRELQVIAPNVISSLSNLEELRTGSFAEWEVEGLNNERRNTSLHELKHLSKLTALQICIKDVKTLPGDLFFKNLKRYQILITRNPWFLEKPPPEISRQFKLELTNTNICLNDGHIMELKSIEDLRLRGLQDMKNVLYGSDREGFLELKHLEVAENPSFLCMVDSTSMEYATRNAFPLLESLSLVNLTNMEKICRGQLTAQSFCKLRKINVNGCDKLKNIFSSFIATSLQQLQSIRVVGCGNLQEIFGPEDESNNNSEVIDNMELDQLRSLELCYLPQLTSFCSKSKQRGEVLTTYTLFSEKVALPKLEDLHLYETKVEIICQNFIAAISCGIQNLTRLTVSGCSNLKCLFSSSIASCFVRLKYLAICECPALEDIVAMDGDRLREEEKKNVVFPQLEFLRMSSLENLTKFCSGDYIEFPSLKELKIKECPELKGFMVKNISSDLTEIALFNEEIAFPSLEQMSVKHCDKLQTLFPRKMYRKFLRLESLTVKRCGLLEVIFDLDGPNFEETHGAATQLSVLAIDGLPKLKHVWNKDPQKFLSFEKLNRVRIENCDELRNVFPASVASSLSQLKMLDITRCGVEEIVFVSEEEGAEAETKQRFVFPSVNSLTLDDLPKCKTFFPGIHTTEWPALENLVVSGWETVTITTQQPTFLVEKVFPNLEQLVVKGKGIAKLEQFPENLLCKLKFLDLVFDESTVFSSLDFLQRFHSIKMLRIGGGKYKTSSQVKIKTLAWMLAINKCCDLKQILKEETNMDHLVHLELRACYNLINLVPSSTSFQNLTTLKLRYCHGLTYIVTSSTAKSLVQLRVFDISKCNGIKEIVATDGGDAAKDDEIVFRELKYLPLICLESLTSFCSGYCNFSFPSLEQLRVIKCPKMNIFSAGGGLSTPSLHKVTRDSHDEAGCWEGDLNTTIQKLH